MSAARSQPADAPKITRVLGDLLSTGGRGDGQYVRVDVDADLRAIEGAEVAAITLDYRVSLLLIDPGDPQRLNASLIFGSPFAYRDSEVDADKPSTMADCWRLLRRKIVAASADEDLNLSLSFDDGSSLRVDRHQQYETWELKSRGVLGVLVGRIDLDVTADPRACDGPRVECTSGARRCEPAVRLAR